MKIQAFLLLAATLFSTLHAREWTLPDGQKIEAEYAGRMGDVVFLKKADGSRIKLAWTDLTAADRTALEATNKGNVTIQKSTTPPASNGTRPPKPRPAVSARSHIFNALADKLVRPKAESAGFEAASLSNPAPDYVLVYFSAAWCGPCRHFTPQLRDFYNQNKSNNDRFEVVFVSSDNSERDMRAYINEAAMPWPALRFAEMANTPELTQYAGNGIPCLVLLDTQGVVLAHSYVNNNYVGPQVPLQRLTQLLNGTAQ